MDAWAMYAFDIGNTQVKLAGRADDGGLTMVGAWPHGEWPDRWPLPAGAAVAIASVRPADTATLMASLAAQGAAVVAVAGSDGGVFRAGLLRSAVEQPNVVGVDRLLAAVAAHHRFPGQPVITVDAGSALTVDLTTGEGTFAGGAILPGLRLMAHALASRTAALPEVSFADGAAPPFPGRSTAQAITAGIVLGTAGAIDRLIVELSAAAGAPSPAIVLTGGDAPLLAPRLHTAAKRCSLVPTLVLEGLLRYADAVARGNAP